MSKLIRFQPLTALAITGLTVSMMTTGCEKIQEAQQGLCCTGFVVGADMSAVDFGLEGEVKGQFTALAQASGDLSAVATGALDDVAIACENMARDMGAASADVDAAAAKTGTAKVTALCDLATAQINATFGASAQVKGTLKVDFQEPKCTASIDAQAKCEGSCTVDAKCDAMATLPTCDGGKLTVECNGGCQAKAGVSVSCTGTCTGKCSGSCKADVGATVDCEGTCEGNCTADGTANSASGVQADGTCKGKCDGKCTAKADAKVDCKGTCEGSCDARCEAKAGVKFTCDAECDGEIEAPKCEGGTAKLDCKADADCQANCSASASAKAECRPPSLAITYAVSGNVTADAQVKIDAGIASLKANLPNLLVVLKARGQAFFDGIEATGKIGVKLAEKPGNLDVKAVACLVPIGAAVTAATDNFKAAFEASGKVAGAVKIGS